MLKISINFSSISHYFDVQFVCIDHTYHQKKLVTVHNKAIGASLLPGIKAYFPVTFVANNLGFFDLCLHCGSIVRFSIQNLRGDWPLRPLVPTARTL